MNGYVKLPRNNYTEPASIPCVGYKGGCRNVVLGKGANYMLSHIHLPLKTELLVLT